MKKKILIIGASGLLGNTLLKFFSKKVKFAIFATIRSANNFNMLENNLHYCKIFDGIDVNNKIHLENVFSEVIPDIVINCVGIIKQSKEIDDHFKVISINTLLPHYLLNLSTRYSSRFIHFSTDCVFSGSKGNYTEDDLPDAQDLYGRSKLLGEVYYGNSITLRTSIIGHELNSSKSLVDWFLSKDENTEGYKKAIFSGLTTYEIATVIHDYIINTDLVGLYHLSADPISKYELLLLIKDIYGKTINVIPDEKKVVVNRSLDSSRFRKATGFLPKSWPLMIKEMYNFR
jgi:dTDP-4-dehydrorhamnose reductase